MNSHPIILTPSFETLLTEQQAAAYLAVSIKTLQNWRWLEQAPTL